MEEDKVKDQAVQLLQQHLQIAPEEPLGGQLPVPSNLNELKQKLTQLIAFLLDHDFQRLLNAMYRIDVPESKFKQVLIEGTKGESVAAQIADLVLERELQKVRTRILYSGLNRRDN